MQSLFNKRNQTPSLNSLFSQPPTNIIQPQTPPSPPPLSTIQPIQQQPQNIHQTQQQKAQKLTRTIFIGNVKIDTQKKQLKKLLEPYGKVQKVWYRSVPVEQSKMGPKASFILKKFQEDAQSMNAYARFQNLSSVAESLELNGTIFNGLTLRVTSADNKEMDFEKTIFVGNLPFEVKEEELRQFCSKVGVVENVRVIRNQFTHKGIGIAYVMFEDAETMKKAIKELNGKVFRERAVRVKKAVEKKRLDKKRNKYIDPKEVNRNAALKRIEERNKEGFRNKREERREEKSAHQKPVQNETHSKSQQKSFSVQKPQHQHQHQSQSQSKPQHQSQSTPKHPSITQPQQKTPPPHKPKKTPLNQKKRPHVVTEMDQQDKNLSKQVTEQLKLLKRNMISKKK